MGTLPQGATEAANLSNISLHAELLMSSNAQGFSAGGINLGTATLAAPTFSISSRHADASMQTGFPAPASPSASGVMLAMEAQPVVSHPAAMPSPPGDASGVVELTAHDVETIVNGKVWN